MVFSLPRLLIPDAPVLSLQIPSARSAYRVLWHRVCLLRVAWVLVGIMNESLSGGPLSDHKKLILRWSRNEACFGSFLSPF